MVFRFARRNLRFASRALLFVLLLTAKRPAFQTVVQLLALLIPVSISFKLAQLLALLLVKLNATANVPSRPLVVVSSSHPVLGRALLPSLVLTALSFVQSPPSNQRMTPPPTVTLHPLITPIPPRAQRTHWATFRALSLVQPVLKFSPTPPAPTERPPSRTLPR